jgi:hypothetical protein
VSLQKFLEEGGDRMPWQKDPFEEQLRKVRRGNRLSMLCAVLSAILAVLAVILNLWVLRG